MDFARSQNLRMSHQFSANNWQPTLSIFFHDFPTFTQLNLANYFPAIFLKQVAKLGCLSLCVQWVVPNIYLFPHSAVYTASLDKSSREWGRFLECMYNDNKVWFIIRFDRSTSWKLKVKSLVKMYSRILCR